ncbi:MAG: asparagine synthase (glutamine-hydrolyzing) [candidate division KSB1 bacterium]|nr:asparagine synthase (glutamine-hydrolyzing) [candidate division KSB1 bacterium]
MRNRVGLGIRNQRADQGIDCPLTWIASFEEPMCGICGVMEKGRQNQALVTAMCRLLAHRGPDHEAVYQAGDVCLGHRRLSIIDLATGNQPIFNDDRTLAIVYNGEIYNYRELRRELLDRGATFYTKSDTEVILRLYELDGPDAFIRLNGIFAFAILDRRGARPRLILARDHFGVKPLHYFSRPGLFVFASEYKAILLHPAVERKLNPQALHHQINLRYNQTDETLAAGIRKLPPAHYLIVEDGQVIALQRYFVLEPRIEERRDIADWLQEIPLRLRQAVERQLVSDVPIGVYLSGGLDSGSIVAMMHEAGVREIRTFTLGFNEPTDENEDALLTAERYGTIHHSLKLDMNPMRRMPEVIWHAEEPKINLLQGFAMSEFVSQHVKVVLGGLGGDELFAGYDIHRLTLPFNRLLAVVPQEFDAAIGAKLALLLYRAQTRLLPAKWDEVRRGLQAAVSVGNLRKFYLILRNVWDYDLPLWRRIYAPTFLQQTLQPIEREFAPLFERYGGLSPLDQIFAVEFSSKMVNDYLLVEDRMSMAHSLEERVPFLDLDLVRFGFSIPSRLKMLGGKTKGLLRKAMAPYLPEKIIRKKKWGFTFNPYLQFQKDLKSTAEAVLTRAKIERDGIFNYDFIRTVLDAKPHPRLRWHYNLLWVLTGFYIWKQMFLESDAFVKKEFDLKRYCG